MKRKLNILVALCLLVACVVVFVSASTSLTYWYSISTNTYQDSIDSDTIGCC